MILDPIKTSCKYKRHIDTFPFSVFFPVFIIFQLILATPLQPSSSRVELQVISVNNMEYISIFDFVKKMNIDNSFDIITQRGKLYYKGHAVVYQVGFSLLLVDGMLAKSSVPVIRRRGEVLCPGELISDLIYQLFKDAKIQRKGNRYIISRGADRNTVENRNYKPYSKAGKDRIRYIVIDPGHGGKDPGAIGSRKIKEKRITLMVSRYLSQYLRERFRNIKIIMTRSKDSFLELGKRTEIANRLLRNGENGLFISIHVNASVSRKISGFETYFLSQNPTNEDARTTAALENNVVVLEDKSGKSYNDIDYIEALMLTTQIQKESSIAAHCIQKKLSKGISEFKSRGVKKADFFVLRGALMPAVLVELGYISSRKEMKYLVKKYYQKKLAMGIGSGIVDFIKKYNKMIKK